MWPAIATVFIIIALYLGTYLLNRRTPQPVDAAPSSEACESCMNYSCGFKQRMEED